MPKEEDKEEIIPEEDSSEEKRKIFHETFHIQLGFDWTTIESIKFYNTYDNLLVLGNDIAKILGIVAMKSSTEFYSRKEWLKYPIVDRTHKNKHQDVFTYIGLEKFLTRTKKDHGQELWNHISLEVKKHMLNPIQDIESIYKA